MLAHDMRYTIMIVFLLVAGCAVGGERIYNLITHRSDPSGYLFADGQTGSNIATHISGNPFGVAPETLANIVGAGLQSAFANTSVTFVTRPTENVRRNMIMVVAFDPPVGTKPAVLCRAPGRTPWAPSSKTVRAMMAFCFGTAPLVSIEGRIPRSGGAGDRDFVLLIRDMALRMFEAGPMNAP